MIETHQVSLAFSSAHRTPCEGQREDLVWLGAAVDHHLLFDALQDEWLRPTERGWILGVRRYIGRDVPEANGNRITVLARVDTACLPNLHILVRREGRWQTTEIRSLRTTDEAIFWPGALPTFAISGLSVAGPEERARLLSLAKLVSNITFPANGSVDISSASVEWNRDGTASVDIPPGIELTAEMDAIRGATTMAMWAVPRTDPWLDILTTSLALQDPEQDLTRVARRVDARWWGRAPWSKIALETSQNSLQERLWKACLRCLRKLPRGGLRATDLLAELAAQAAQDSDRGDVATIDAWREETMRILRAEAVIRLDDWKQMPVGKAIQLVLTRPEPMNFRTWLDDLPELPPAVWWSAAVLCGFMQGYRRLDGYFRGDAAQRRFLAIHALHVGAAARPALTWPDIPCEPLAWHRNESGTILLTWGDVVLAKKALNSRGRWFATDLADPNTREVARTLAKRHGWACLCTEIALHDDILTLHGSGSASVGTTPGPHIHVRGTLRLRLPRRAVVEEVLDIAEFRRCIATEGAAGLQDPPTIRIPRSPERTSIEGLVYVADFLSPDEEQTLMAAIDGAEWISELQRRVQHYGWRYDYKARKVASSMYLGPLPGWALGLARRLAEEGLLPHQADQVIVNEYVGNQGISKHVDCIPCFEDGIATISLLESWEMVFRRGGEKVMLKLGQRSAAIMSGEARYKWTHEIPKRLNEPDGTPRRRRISITFRKVRMPSGEHRQRT